MNIGYNYLVYVQSAKISTATPQLFVGLQNKEVVMCVFCAAIPATLAVGANINAKQIRERREAEGRGEALPEKKPIPVGKITVIAMGALVTASVVYHTQFNG